MSIYSDYKCGALTEEEYHGHCVRVNREEREWIDEWERMEYESEERDNDRPEILQGTHGQACKIHGR